MNLPPLSHTFFSDYECCPKLVYHKYIAKDVPKEKKEAFEKGNAVHDAMERRLMHGRPLPDELKQFEGVALAIEQLRLPLNGEMTCGITADWKPTGFWSDDVWFRCKIDCPIVFGHLAIMLDWKTGKKREDPAELQRHAVVLKAHFPELSVIKGHYVWMQNDGEIGQLHNCSDTDGIAHGMKMQAVTIARNAELGHWPARENWRCKWCPVHHCPYNKAAKQ